MRKPLLLSIAMGVLLALTVATAATAIKSKGLVKVKSGNIELLANGGFTPTTLSKTKPTPIGLTVEGEIKTLDGSHLPAVKEVEIETDKNGAINVKGYPVCKSGKIQATDTSHAEKNCKSSIVGKGKTEIEILFEESKKIITKSNLVVFNGGFKGGVTTLYIHAYITFPVPAAVVTTVKIKKIHKGPYGLLSVAKIPKIAGGTGSVKSFSLEINKKFSYKGKQVSVLTLKCPNGRVPVHAKAKFSDGTNVSADIPRTCTGRG